MAKSSTVRTSPNTPAKSPNAGSVLPITKNVLRKLGADEKFTPSARELEPGRWEVRSAAKIDKKSTDRYEFITVYDFRQVSPAECQRLALKHCVIVTQADWREMAANPTTHDAAMQVRQWANRNVKVDIVDAVRKTADPVAKAASALSKAAASMTAEQRAEMIKMLQSVDAAE